MSKTIFLATDKSMPATSGLIWFPISTLFMMHRNISAAESCPWTITSSKAAFRDKSVASGLMALGEALVPRIAKQNFMRQLGTSNSARTLRFCVFSIHLVSKSLSSFLDWVLIPSYITTSNKRSPKTFSGIPLLWLSSAWKLLLNSPDTDCFLPQLVERALLSYLA